MLVKVDAQDISALSQQFAKLVSALVEAVNMSALPIEVDITPRGNFRGFDANKFYVVKDGTIAARYQAKTIYTLQLGEILLPDIAGSIDEKIAVFYDEESFNSFNLIEGDVLKIKSYKHLLKRIEQDSVDSMISSNRAGD